MNIVNSVHWKMEPFFAGGVWLDNPLLWPWLFVSFLAGLFFLGWLRAWRKRQTVLAFISGLVSREHGAIASYRRSLPQFAVALSRARRYQHPITVAVLSLGREQLVQSMRNLAGGWTNANLASHFYFSFVGALLRDNLRESDVVTYDAAADQFVILLTETSAAGAEQALLRLNALVYKHTAVALRLGTAEFPADGLIIEDLVGCAQARCSRGPISAALLSVDVSNSLAAPVTRAPAPNKPNGANGVAKVLVRSSP
jgi:hypothetical protein